jgi:LysR family transcriptional regulator, nitrogen assimilation regulatory protein
MNLTQLRYFVAIARNNSLSRAATDLHISQPALTRQIKLLEDEFGSGLLQRHARGVSLTDLGQILLERAERQLRDFEQLRSDVADASIAPTGRLRIGCPPSLSTFLLVRPLKMFRQTYPKVVVEVRESVSDDLSKAVLHDRLDIAIVSATGLETSSHFLTEALFSEPVWLFGPRRTQARLANRSLDGMPLILTHSNNAARDALEREMRRSGHQLNVVAETDSPRLMVEMIKAGAGYTIAPYLTFIQQLRTRELSGRPLKRLKVERTLIRRKDRSVSKAMRLFTSFLRPEIETACKEIAKARS